MDEPRTPSPPELQFRLHVDAALCERAAQGLRLMGAFQYRSTVGRYEATRWVTWTKRSRRVVLPVIGLLAFLGGLVALLAGWVSRLDRGPHTVVWNVLAAILFVEAVVLWVLPFRAEQVSAGIRVRFERMFGNWAARRMRKARRAAPFEGVYDLRGDLLAYSRVESGHWRQLWHRNLDKFRARGVALRTPDVLAIFHKPGAVLPSVLVLLRDDPDDAGICAAIRATGWTIVDLDPATGAPVARDAGPATQ